MQLNLERPDYPFFLRAADGHSALVNDRTLQDMLIEARERRTVADIFAKHGEPYFRGVEREILKLLLPLRHAVVATGGGTFMDPENRAAINVDGLSVWLDVPFEQLIARIPADGRR